MLFLLLFLVIHASKWLFSLGVNPNIYIYIYIYIYKITISLSHEVGQNQKGRLWVHETPILEVFLWPSLRTHLTWQMTPRDLGNIYTTGNSCRDTLLYGTWQWNYLSIFTCWWKSVLFGTSNFGTLNIRWYSAIRKRLFLS